MLRTIFVSITFSVFFGPAIVLLEMFFIKLATKGIAEPILLIFYPLALVVSIVITIPFSVAYGIIIHLLFSIEKIREITHRHLFSSIIGSFVGLFFGMSLVAYGAYQKAIYIDASYTGKLAAFKPKNVFINEAFSDGSIYLVLVPSLLCGALIPFFLKRPNK